MIPWLNQQQKQWWEERLKKLAFHNVIENYFFVKEAVLPFDKFPNVNKELGPEMKSTGEVMG